MSNTIKIRSGTAANLATLGALEANELGRTSDTDQVFIGDGAANHEFVMHDLFDAQSV